jgi:hypothetical protein
VTPTRDTPLRVEERRNGDAVVYDPQARASAGLIIGAFLAMAVSAWAGIVPFVGPLFNFSADGSLSWTWNRLHALASLAPGAVGVLVCMLVLASVMRPRELRSPVALGTWGFALFVCGAWLTVAPIVWAAVVGPYFLGTSPTMTLAYWLGYASGPGILLAGFGAFVMGRSQRMPRSFTKATTVDDDRPVQRIDDPASIVA